MIKPCQRGARTSKRLGKQRAGCRGSTNETSTARATRGHQASNSLHNALFLHFSLPHPGGPLESCKRCCASFLAIFLKKKHAIVRGARGRCFFDTLTAVLLSRLLCLALVLSAALLLSQFRPPWLPASPVLYVQCLRPPTPSPVARHFATAFIYASRALSGGVVCTRGGMRWL
jgi:hypothetical protein